MGLFSTRDPQTVRDAIYLAYCAPDAAYHWLKSREVRLSGVFGIPDTPKNAHLLEYILARRNHPLIDLGLAEHGRSRTVLQRVYRRASPSVRATACGNASLFVGEEISTEGNVILLDTIHEARNDPPLASARHKQPSTWDILENGTEDELRMLCQNPYLFSVFYTAVFESYAKPDRPLADERYQRVLFYIGGNPRLATPREKSAEANYHDGFADYEYNKVFTAAWALAGQVPVTIEWAFALSKLYEHMQRGFNREELPAMIERWRPAPPQSDGIPFQSAREHLARQMSPTIAMLNSDDVALRRAFYATFSLDAREFRDLDWSLWYERDPIDCLIWLDGNDRVWRSPRGRKKLFALYSEDSRKRSDYVHMGWAREREQKLRELHPEWFADEEIDGEREPTSRDIIDRIGSLETIMTSVLQALTRRTQTFWGSIFGALILLMIGYLLGRGSHG